MTNIDEPEARTLTAMLRYTNFKLAYRLGLHSLTFTATAMPSQLPAHTYRNAEAISQTEIRCALTSGLGTEDNLASNLAARVSSYLPIGPFDTLVDA